MGLALVIVLFVVLVLDIDRVLGLACKMTQSVSLDFFRSDGRGQTVFEDEDDDENDYECQAHTPPSS